MSSLSAPSKKPQIRPKRIALMAKPAEGRSAFRLVFIDDTYNHSNSIDKLKPPANQALPIGLCFCEARAEATVYNQSNPPG